MSNFTFGRTVHGEHYCKTALRNAPVLWFFNEPKMMERQAFLSKLGPKFNALCQEYIDAIEAYCAASDDPRALWIELTLARRGINYHNQRHLDMAEQGLSDPEATSDEEKDFVRQLVANHAPDGFPFSLLEAQYPDNYDACAIYAYLLHYRQIVFCAQLSGDPIPTLTGV
jgi:hypothetical protein